MSTDHSKKTVLGEVHISVSNRTVIRVLALVILSTIFLAALRQAGQAIVMLFTAFFLALALNAPVQWVARNLPGTWRGNRSLATILSVIVVILLVSGFFASLVPPISRQIGGLIDAAPGFVDQVHNQNGEIGRLISHYHLQSQVDNFSSELTDRLKNIGSEGVSAVARIGSSAFSVLTILVLTVMMLIEGPHWVKLGQQLLPAGKRDHANELARAMYKVIKGYVNGQVTLAAIAALLISPMLFILHVNYPIALVAVVFVCGLIPMVGHTLGAIIVTTVALFHSPVSAVLILAYYILYQQIENYLVQPRIQANTTNMSPLLVFVAVVLGVNFGGLLGGLVAIPLMGCVRILILDQLTRRKILETDEAKQAVAQAEAHK